MRAATLGLLHSFEHSGYQAEGWVDLIFDLDIVEWWETQGYKAQGASQQLLSGHFPPSSATQQPQQPDRVQSPAGGNHHQNHIEVHNSFLRFEVSESTLWTMAGLCLAAVVIGVLLWHFMGSGAPEDEEDVEVELDVGGEEPEDPWEQDDLVRETPTIRFLELCTGLLSLFMVTQNPARWLNLWGWRKGV